MLWRCDNLTHARRASLPTHKSGPTNFALQDLETHEDFFLEHYLIDVGKYSVWINETLVAERDECLALAVFRWRTR